MSRLAQIIAVEKGSKSRTENSITEAYKTLQKADTFAGISKTYKPKDEEGEVLPSEYQKVINKAQTQLESFADNLSALFDITATKVWGNTKATADIVIDGEVLIAAVPVEYLLFMEKRLINVLDFLSKLPTLDPATDWTYDAAKECYEATPVQSIRSKKIPRNHVKAQATDKHAEQVEVYYEDTAVGTYTKVALSGAVPAATVTAWRKKVIELQKAVKFAREEANSIEVEPQHVGAKVFDYLFA